MLALGIILVIVGFVSLPNRGNSGPGGRRNVDMGLQGVHQTVDADQRHPEWRSVVARGLLSFAIVAAGLICIALGS